MGLSWPFGFESVFLVGNEELFRSLDSHHAGIVNDDLHDPEPGLVDLLSDQGEPTIGFSIHRRSMP